MALLAVVVMVVAILRMMVNTVMITGSLLSSF
jgi:hypothetical protein